MFDFAEQNQIERRLGWTGYGDSGRNTKSVSELRRQHQSIVLWDSTVEVRTFFDILRHVREGNNFTSDIEC